MSTITTIPNEPARDSRSKINGNFAALNEDKLEGSDISALVSHAASTSNPHSVTKSQVGLGSVDNYPTASQVQAEAGTAADRFMTPQRVAQLLAAMPFTAWTPAWSGGISAIGNAAVTARHFRVGKLVLCSLKATFGSTTAFTAGTIVFSLPFTLSGLDGIWGSAQLTDANGSIYVAAAQTESNTQARLTVPNASGTYLTAANVTNAVPFTWTTSDSLSAFFWYEAA